MALLAICVAACGGRPSPTEPGAISPVAQGYLDELIGTMQAHSINRLKIDWTAFRASVMKVAGTPQTVAEAAPGIQEALRLLGDGHSFYVPVKGQNLGVGTRSCGAQSVNEPTLPATIGYVRVRSFSGTPTEATAFANALQRTIAAADRDDLIGWIVDARGNGGGNMWPMIAGVGPILGEGLVGHFIDPDGTQIPWEYRDGASWEGGSADQRVDAPYRLRRERPRVAVLFDAGTASSGEAVVIAFQQRPDTRSFGPSATCGLSTANQVYTMSDGASLYLTVAVMADRTKVPYGGPVPPDEWVMDFREVDQRAVAWLRQAGS